jgi:hypothetical protein
MGWGLLSNKSGGVVQVYLAPPPASEGLLFCLLAVRVSSSLLTASCILPRLPRFQSHSAQLYHIVRPVLDDRWGAVTVAYNTPECSENQGTLGYSSGTVEAAMQLWYNKQELGVTHLGDVICLKN